MPPRSALPGGLAPDQPLDIRGKNGSAPFSQARLQQSLLAAGLVPLEAFEAALAIERELRDEGKGVVVRDDLRSRVAGFLEDFLGAETARRYRTWRVFHAQDERPIIVLLGGTTGVGKSTLALEVARRLSIGRMLSTDSIRDVMRMMLTEDLMPTLHVSSFEAHAQLTEAVAQGEDPVIEGFLEQSRTVAVGIRAVVERAITEGTHTVLDGVSLVPGLIDPSVWADRAHVFFLLLADEDRDSLREHLLARAHGRGARASERYVRNFETIFAIQQDLVVRAREAGIPVVDVRDVDGGVQQVVNHVVDRLAEEGEAELTVGR